jgi:hypothetical protein
MVCFVGTRRMGIAGIKEMNAVVSAYTKMSLVRLLVLTIAGLLTGIFANDGYRNLQNGVIFNKNPQHLIYFQNHYIGIPIDRTRNNFCDLHPQRMIFSYQDIDGKTIPIILPVLSGDYTWPQLGRVQLGVLVKIPDDLPPGKWYIQSVVNENCNWIERLMGGRTKVNAPLEIKFP